MRWKSERSISGAVTVTQTMTVTLKSWAGDRVVLGVTFDESGQLGVRVPGTSETVTLRRYSNEGTGTRHSTSTAVCPPTPPSPRRGRANWSAPDESAPIVQQEPP